MCHLRLAVSAVLVGLFLIGCRLEGPKETSNVHLLSMESGTASVKSLNGETVVPQGSSHS